MQYNFVVLLGDIKQISAEMVIILTIVVIMLMDILAPRGDKTLLAYISLGGTLLAALVCCTWNGVEQSIFSGALVVDRFAFFFKLMLFTITALTQLMSINYVKLRNINRGEFHALVLFATLGMLIMVSGADLLSIYLGLELNAIACCVLVAFLRQNVKSNEAALKYFVLSLFSSGILLYGISLVYGVTGEINIYKIARYLSGQQNVSHPMLHLGLVLLVVGFGFKVAYVPFHMWVPDVYEGAPISVAAFLSLGPKAAGFAVLVRIVMVAVFTLKVEWSILFSLLAVVTMTLGNLTALCQENIRRLLAYSGIAHVGYMLMGLVAAANYPQLGITSVIFYLLCYVFFNIGPFGIIILLCNKHKICEFIGDFDGLSVRSPLSAFVMTIFLLSLAGIPPMVGFVAKFLIFMAAMKAELYWLVAIGIINSAIAMFYYLRIVVAMYVRAPKPGLKINASPSLTIALAIMVGFTLLMGIYPALFIGFARYSIATLL